MDELNDNEEVPPPTPVRARAKPSSQTGRSNVKAKLDNKKKNATEDTSDDKANVRSKFGRLPTDLSNSLSATHKQKSKTDEHVNLESKLVRTRNRRTSFDEESPSGEESPSDEKAPTDEEPQSDEKAPIHEQEKEMDELNDNKEVRPPKPVRARAEPSMQTGNVRAKLDNKKKNATGSNLKTEDTSDDKANVRSEYGSLPSGLSTSLPAIPKHKSKTDEQVSLEMKLNKLALSDEESSSSAESPINEKPSTNKEPQRDEEPLNYSSFKLIIICKTTMHGGLCFMGLDTKRNRLLRPICSTNECCWPENASTDNIHVGSLLRFRVTYHPDQHDKTAFRTPYPHRKDDMLVEKNIIVGKQVPNVLELLLPLSKQDIYDIFPQNLIINDRYIIENAECPSVGILLTNERSVRCHTRNQKPRVYIDSRPGLTFDFPNTAISYDTPGKKRNRNCLVILGLSRPWRKNTGSPFGCYILVIGIILF